MKIIRASLMLKCCHLHGTKTKCDSLMGFEPMTSQIQLVGCSNYGATERLGGLGHFTGFTVLDILQLLGSAL